MKLYEKLRFVRKHKRMKLKDVSALTGKSISYLSEIERGIASPSMATFLCLSQAYNQSMSQLMSGVDEI